MKNAYMIVCKSGVLSQGMSNDFLATIMMAKQEKARFALLLPHSHLRVQLFYPNRRRVAPQDIKAALRALADEKVMSAVLNRIYAASADRGRSGRFLKLGVGSVFSQAGVVAPPDSPDLGNSPVLVDSLQGL